MKIKCVITDDEPVARKGIQGYIDKVSFLELVGICDNAMDLNDLLKEKEVDLLFLNISCALLAAFKKRSNEIGFRRKSIASSSNP